MFAHEPHPLHQDKLTSFRGSLEVRFIKLKPVQKNANFFFGESSGTMLQIARSCGISSREKKGLQRDPNKLHSLRGPGFHFREAVPQLKP